MIVLDASVLIAYLDAEDARQQDSSAHVRPGERGGENSLQSTRLTIGKRGARWFTGTLGSRANRGSALRQEARCRLSPGVLRG